MAKKKESISTVEVENVYQKAIQIIQEEKIESPSLFSAYEGRPLQPFASSQQSPNFPKDFIPTFLSRLILKHFEIAPSLIVDILKVLIPYINEKRVKIEDLEDCVSSNDFIKHLKSKFPSSDVEIIKNKEAKDKIKYNIIDLRKTEIAICQFYWKRDASVSETIYFLDSVENLYAFFYLIEYKIDYLFNQNLENIDLHFLKNIIPKCEEFEDKSNLNIYLTGIWEF